MDIFLNVVILLEIVDFVHIARRRDYLRFFFFACHTEASDDVTLVAFLYPLISLSNLMLTERCWNRDEWETVHSIKVCEE